MAREARGGGVTASSWAVPTRFGRTWAVPSERMNARSAGPRESR
jgi:hypothetical protein